MVDDNSKKAEHPYQLGSNGAISSKFEASASGTIAGIKNAAAKIDTPQELLNSIEGKLSGMNAPIPAGKVLTMFDSIKTSSETSPMSKFMNAARESVMPHLTDDAALDRGEILQTVAAMGNSLHAESNPKQEIVEQASGMLGRLGVEDQDGSLAKGMARFAIAGAINAQKLEATPTAEVINPMNNEGLSDGMSRPYVSKPLP